MKDILNYLFKGNFLSRGQSSEILREIGEGKHSEIETASFLTVYNMRAITAEELAGFRDAMLGLCHAVDLIDMETIDVCGTGGDGKNTFNISTLAAFIIAGAGIKVSKHGNYGLSSPCGSSNIFEHLGYKFSNDNDKLRKEIETTNLCYFHAPLFHPAMKYVAPVRKAMKVKTFFNMLGPLINPAQPQYQLTGTFDMEVLGLYNGVFRQTGTRHVIIHSAGGYDEISLTGNFHCVVNHTITEVSPQSMGMGLYTSDELHGGNTVDEAVKIFLNVLENNATRAQMDVALVNAAYGIKCVYPDKRIEDCIQIARESVESKKALNVLKSLIALNEKT